MKNRIFNKRVLSFLLTLLMIVGVFPAGSFVVSAATTEEPYWDKTANDPYILHVAAGEADEVTQSQLYKLLDYNWDTENTGLRTQGGFKYGENRITDWADGSSAGLVADTTYDVFTGKITYSWLGTANGTTWTKVATFKVVEPEVKDEITLKPATNGEYEVRVNFNTYAGLRDKIIAAVVDKINNGAVNANEAVVKFNYKKSGVVGIGDKNEMLVLSAETLDKFVESENKSDFEISYNTATPQKIVVKLVNEQTASSIAVKDGEVLYYTGMDTAVAKVNIFNAIYNGGIPNLTVADVTIEVKGLLDWYDVMSTLGEAVITGAQLGDSVNARIVYAGNDEYSACTSASVSVKLVDSRSEVDVSTPVEIPFAESGMFAALVDKINAVPSDVTYSFNGATIEEDADLVEIARKNPNGVTVKVNYTTKNNDTYKASDAEVQVTFTGVYYNVLVNGGTVNNGETSVRVNYGETVRIEIDKELEHTYTLAVDNGTLVKNEDDSYSLSDVTIDTKLLTITDTINTYTITWTVNGEAYGEPSTFDYDALVNAPAYTTPEGYTFSGWDIPEKMPAKDITLNATLTINTYNITWVVDGVETIIGYEYNTLVSKDNPVKEGWGFVGWFDEDGNKVELTNYKMPAKDLKLTAKFFEAEAMIGETPYETLADAVAAVKAGETIVLLKNLEKAITFTTVGNITLDLNGMTLSSSSDTVSVTTAGTVLTIKNGTITSTGNYCGAVYVKNGEVILDSCTLKGLNETQSYAVYASDNSTITINNCELTAKDWALVMMSANVTVNSGKFEAQVGISANGSDDHDDANLTINGGTITGTGCAIYWPANGLLTINGGEITGTTAVYLKSGSLDITGGTLTGNGDAVDYEYKDSGLNSTGEALVIENVGTGEYDAIDTVSITGGTFVSKNATNAVGSYAATSQNPDAIAVDNFIKGGNFSSNVNEFAVEGYKAEEIESGVWGVREKKQLTVSFEGIDPVIVTEDDKVAVPEGKPTKDQAIFGGWDFDFSTPITENITVSAKWIVDLNSNNVPDDEETITIVISGKGAFEGQIIGIGDDKYVFDSTKNSVTIIATPVVENGISKSFVAYVTGATLTYGEGYKATAVLNVKNGDKIEVTFTDCVGFEYDEDGEMRFYVGMETPKYETLYNAVIKNPIYNSEFVKSVKYLARPAATYQMQVPVLFEYTVPLINYKIKIGGDMVDIDLDDAWLDVGESFKTLTPEELQKQYDVEIQKIKDKIAAIDLSDISLSNAWDKVKQFATISEELTTLIQTISNEAQYLGYHQFGASGLVDENGNAQEILQVIYDDGKMHLVDEEVYVTLVDDRIATEITGGNLTFEYDEFTDADIMNSLVLKDADGNVIDGELTKYVDLAGTEVGTRTYTVSYGGSWDYKPCEVTFTLEVIKAPSSVAITDSIITYGDKADLSPVVTNKHGVAIDIDTIEFILGLDISELDIDGDGVKGLEGRMQLILTDELQTILSVVGLEEGLELNINDLIETLTNTGLLEQWGVSGEMVDTLKQVLDAINGVVEANNLMITIGGDYPTDVGAYLQGAVTVDANYETAFDVGYVVIKPQATRVYLDWNYSDANGVFTWDLLEHINLGASAYNNEAFTDKNADATALINNLFFGLDISGEFVIGLHTPDNTDVEKLENALGMGAFVQLAFIADFGNEMSYAVPIVRPVVIIPSAVNVELVGSTGTPNNELLKEFNNQPQGFEVIVKDGNGKVIYSTHYQNVVENNNAQVEIRYIGVQSNGVVYNSTEKPVHAGAYAVYAIYLEFNTEGNTEVKKIEIDFSKFDFENFDMSQLTALQDLYDLKCVGADIGALVIKPTSSTVVVTDKIVEGKYEFSESIEVGSTVSGLEPDTTVISAGINLGATAPENIFDAVNGVINIDFPEWVDELLAGKLSDNITVPQLKALLETVSAEMEDGIKEILDQLPENVTLTFDDDAVADKIGAYVVIAIVTDSDHYPSIDAGYLVFVPAISEVELKWNYEDENGVFTRDLLDYIDLEATAYNKETGAANDAKITYKFLGINANNGFDICDDPATLPNGAYIELAYIEFYINNEMVLSDLIARPVVLVASNCTVEIEELRTEFDNTAKIPSIIIKDLEGNTIDATNGQFTYIYAGLQTNGQPYMSDKAPVHAGVYEVIVTYVEYDENGAMRYYGVGVSGILIDLTESTVDVTGGEVEYDSKGHTANVTTGSTAEGLKPDYTLISGGAWITGDIDSVGINALHGNVNIDFPKWFDAVIADTEAFREGVSAAYLIDFIDSYRDDVVAGVADALAKIGVTMNVDQMNAYIDELLAVLAQMPADVTLTFVDNITYTASGDYFYYGIVTDSDHYPSTGTGLVTIAKKAVTITVNDKQMIEGNTLPTLDAVVSGEIEGEPLNYTLSVDAETVGENEIVVTLGENPNYEVTVVNGTLTVVKAVAQNTNTGICYETLAKALADAKDGDIIDLVWAEGDAPIAMNGAVYGEKTVTITGTATVDWSKGFLFIGRGGEGDGAVIFDEAELTSASNSASYGIHVSGREKDTNNKYDGTLIIKNSTIELDYLIDKGEMILHNSTLTVKNGFAIGGRPASETENGEDATATLDLTNGSKVVVNNHNGMGLGYEAIGVMNVDASSTFETTQSFLVTAKGTMNIAGTAKVAGTLTNNGSIVLTAVDATLTSSECGNVTTNVADYKVAYANGAYKLIAKVYVAQIGDAKFESLAEAIAAVQNGETITLLADVTGNVTLTEKAGLSYTIDGNGKTMNGKITISALSDTNDNRRITIKNINFVNTADTAVDFISSVNTNHYPRITVEGCTFTGNGKSTDVAIRLKSSYGVVIKDCTGTGLHSFIQNTSGHNLTIENVKVTDSKSGLALGTVQGVTVKGCNIDVAGYGIRLDANTYNNNAVITDNKVSAFIPVVVRNVNADSNITFAGENTMTATNTDGYWCVIGTSEYEANGELPTKATAVVKVTLNDEGLNEEGVYNPVIRLEGKGTAENPYIINNVEDLIFFRDSVNAGETKYNAEGVYVALGADIDLAGIDWSVNIGDDCNATFDGIFDGKNHTIKNLTSTETAQKADGYICTGLFGAIYGSAQIKNLTLENVNINAEFKGNNVGALVGFVYEGNGAVIENVVINGVNIYAPKAYGVGAIVGYAYYGNSLTIKNCSVVGTNSIITRSASSAISASSAASGIIGYSSSYGLAVERCSVKGVALNATAIAGGLAGVVTGGTFTNNTVENVTLTVTGANWKNSAAIAVGTLASTSVTVSGTNYSNVNATDIVGSQYAEQPTTPVAKIQAKIGDTYYATFAAAYTAAQAGDTITLLAPIVVAKDETLTLDKVVTITYTSNVAGEDMITNKGTLVIDGATLVYKNTDTTASNVTVSTISCEAGSTLEVKSGVVKNDSANNSATGIYAYAIDLVTNGSLGDVTATISGGKVISTNYMAIRQFVNGTACKNTLTVSGGAIKGATRGINIQLNNNMAYTTITGGVIEGGDYSICFITTSENITVSGGEFKGAVWYSGTKGFISGGTFDAPVAEEHCAEGYIPYEISNGVYGVKKGSFVAQIGDVKFETVAEALAYAKNNGMTEVVITLLDVNSKAEAIALDDSFNLYTKKVFDKVTFKQADASKVYYIASIYTGSRTNGGQFVFDGVNIVVIDQYIFEGNVVLTNNSVIKSVAEANCFIYNNGVTIIEPGSKLQGVIEDFRGGDMIIDGGKTDGSYNTVPDFQDAIIIINWSGDKLVLKNGAYAKINAANEVGRMTINAGAAVEMYASKLETVEYITVNGTLQLDLKSLVSTKKITGNGKIVVDATGFDGNTIQLITADMSGFTGTIEVINDPAVAEITPEGLFIKKAAAAIGNTGYATLQAAIDAAKNGDVITLLENNSENVTVVQTPDVKFTIDGNGKTMTGTITVDGKSAAYATAGLTIKNVNFDATNITKDASINLGGSNATRYTSNVTVTGCTFTGTDKVAIKNYTGGCKNLTVTGCTATGMHSLIQVKGVAGLTVSDVTVSGCKNGIAVGTSTNVTITGATITAAGYGIRADGTGAYDLTVKNSEITANQPIIVRKNTADGYKLTLEDNTLAGAQYGVIITKGDDEEAYVTPEVSIDLYGVTNVFPAYVAKIGNTYYATLEAAIAAANAGNTIELLADVTATKVIEIGESITINGNGHKVTSSATRVFRVTTSDVEVTLDSVNMVSTAVRIGTNDVRGISIDILENVKLTLNNCSVDFTDASANDWAYAVNVTGGSNHILTVNGGTYEGANVINVHGAKNTIFVKDATLTSTYPNNDVYYGACIWVEQEKGSSVEATGNTFNGANAVAFNVGTGTTVTESNNIDNTTRVVAKIGGTYYTSLAEAFTAAQNGDVVVILKAGTYALTTSGKNITITGAVDGVKFDMAKAVGIKASMTFNNVTFEYSSNKNYIGLQHAGTMEYNNCTFNGQVFLYGASETFNNCTFNQDSANAYNVWTYGAKEVAFNECTFNSVGKSVLIYAEQASIFNKVAVTGCTFKASEAAEGKAAIEMDSSLTSGIELTITNSTVEGFGTGNVSGNSLWNNKKDNKTDANNDITVVVDGVTVLAPVKFIVQIGNDKYASLQEAIAAVKNDETIVFLTDIDEDVTIKQVDYVAFTIDGANYKYYGTMTVNGTGYVSDKGQALTIKNVNFMVDGYGIYAYAKKNYARNITVDGCTFTGTNGNNEDYGIALRHVYNIIVKNSTSTNLTDLVYGGGAVTDFTAENVEIINSVQGIWLSYPTGNIKFINVTTSGSKNAGVGVYNNANATVTFTDCTIDKIAYTQEGDYAIEMIFNDKVNNLVASETNKKLTIVLNKIDTTVTAIAGLNATTTVAGYRVAYEDGKYFLVEIDYVAQIGDTKYESIKAAIEAAKDGDIIKLISDFALDADEAVEVSGKKNNKALVYINKNVTFDLNGHNLTAEVPTPVMFVFYGAEGANVVITDNTGKGSVNATGNGLYYMFNNAGTMEVAGGNYIFNGINGGAMFFSENSNMTVTGGNFVQNNTGWMFNTRGDAAGVVITVSGGTFNRYFIGGSDYGENEDGEVKLVEGLGLHKIGENLWTVDKHVAGEAKKENNVAPTFDKVGGYDMVTYCTVCGDKLSTEHHEIAKLIPVAKIGDTRYETLAEAIAAAEAGNTIVLLAHVTEDVTISKNITIDGDNCKYTGMIEVKGSNLTIKNVHFVGGDVYAIKANGGVTKLTVENCTAKGYNFGFLYINKTATNVVVKDATISDCNYGIRYSYGTTMTVENVVMSNVKNGLEVQNFASKSVTIKNSVITSIVIDVRTDKNGVPHTGVQTFNFEGNNTVGTLSASQYAKYVLANKDATLTAPEGFTVTVNDQNYVVKYVNGTYCAVEKEFAARIGDKKYESLTEAIAAAKTGDTIVILEDITLTEADLVEEAPYKTLAYVTGKNITLDMNGKKISLTHEDEFANGYIVALFVVYDGAGLTITGNGTMDINAHDTDPDVAYMFFAHGNGTLTIENGTYHADNLADSMIYAHGNKTVTVNGGNFILDMTGTQTNGCPWIFNVKGQNDGAVVVNGGTFNTDVDDQHWKGEVDVKEGYCVQPNGDDIWTVKEHVWVDATVDAPKHCKYCDATEGAKLGVVAQIGETEYATLAEALADAQKDDKVTLVADAEERTVILMKGITLDLNGKTLTADYLVAFNGNHVVDNATEKGLLKISKSNISLATNNKMMPIYNNDGYMFIDVEFYEQTATVSDTTKLVFKPNFGVANALFADGMDDNDVNIIVRLTWKNTNGNSISQDFEYSEEVIKTAYGSRTGFGFNASGLGKYSDMTIQIVITSSIGVEKSLKTYKVNVVTEAE